MDHRSGSKVAGTFRARPELLNDVGLISKFLKQLISDLGMTTLGTHIYDVPVAIKRMGMQCDCDEGGITGVTVLSTSHAAIHTWPEEGAARFDVDSCRPFNQIVVENLIRQTFDTCDLEVFDLSYCLQPKTFEIEIPKPTTEAVKYILEQAKKFDDNLERVKNVLIRKNL